MKAATVVSDTSRKELRRFYLLLSELFIGLFLDSDALSIGPVDRTRVELQLRASYERLLASQEQVPVRSIRSDHDRVSRLLDEYQGLPPAERSGWLEAHCRERKYLTKKALGYLREA